MMKNRFGRYLKIVLEVNFIIDVINLVSCISVLILQILFDSYEIKTIMIILMSVFIITSVAILIINIKRYFNKDEELP